MGSFWSRPETVPRTPYEYLDPLPKGKIRLLEVQGRLGSGWLSLFQNGRLVYKLITVDLHDSPPFIAISYMWGSPKHTDTILIGDAHVLPVTASAHECLDILSDAKHLWIDAICINQTNHVEKSQNVGMMGEIYSQAIEVVGILGRTTALSGLYSSNILDRASLHLRGVDRFMRRKEASQRDSSLTNPHRRHEQTRLISERSYPEESIFSRFFAESSSAQFVLHQLETHSTALKILRHPYWRRVWIIQELALAKKVTVYHHGVFLRWEQLLSMLNSLEELDKELYNSRPREDWEQGRVESMAVSVENFLAGYQYLIEDRTQLDSVFESRYRRAYLRMLQLVMQIDQLRWSPKHSLKDILIGTTYSQATNPRDKVFALLGLVSPEHATSTSRAPMIMPNYDKSKEEIYTETTLALIKAGDYTTHLLAGGIGWDEEERNMPSWMVNWARPPQIFVDSDTHHGKDRLDKYWAGLGNKPDETEDSTFTIIDPDRILGKFIRLDKIVFLGPQITPESNRWLLGCWGAIDHFVPKGYPYRTPSFPPIEKHEVLWRVLLDVPAVGRPRKVNCYDRACEVETDAFASGFVESNGEQHLCRDLVDSAFREWADLGPPTKPRYHGLRDSFRDALSRSQSNGSRLAISDKGYLGTVPPYSAVGDEIMVHIGCPLPVVLRKAPEQGPDLGFPHIYRRLVGKAHFLGMMRAEWTGGKSVDEIMDAFASRVHKVVLI
ncbi:uncharacterized protein JN550_001614 [Neoarthrinium moseri]|uniref:uncharacterized protein n=1 Tax=Neoarthrinium moseri TaxID=1658444 RepID=UPI001FDBE889|nr:uncharacterized protein JN550_001614 [Neoarthrinium moseri]KAI1876118.1 hypothetical protein JN550_001614 [Neoarthrinium moseri]